MTRNIKRLFSITASMVIGGLVFSSCEPDADQLGSQFFQDGAQGVETEIPVIAYTATNNDTIRTDAARLQTATLGAFNESQFGMQKSDYVTQVRLSSYSPNFGTNPVLDSVVMALSPEYATDSVTTVTNEDYIYPDGAVTAKLVSNTYPVKKYGKAKINTKTLFNIKVNQVNDFLGSNTDKVYSNKSVSTGALLGSKLFDGTVSSVKITKDSDNSSLLERDATLRIKLDSTFFQNNIIKAPAASLTDAASFIRYFRGIKLSVQENDGYIFNFNPNTVTMTLYYKNDKVENGTTTREKNTFTMDMGSANAHFNLITNDRTGTTIPAQDTIIGSSKIYAQGMGGPGIGLKISPETISQIKQKYQSDKIGIVSAKLRIYTDETVWNNKYEKPATFTVQERKINTDGSFTNLSDFLTDMSVLAYAPNYSLVKAYDLDKNPAHYDIGITQTFKNIIEKEAKPRHFLLQVGNYTTDASGVLLGLQYSSYGSQNFNTRSYTPQRAVFVGTEPGNAKSAKLILTYATK